MKVDKNVWVKGIKHIISIILLLCLIISNFETPYAESGSLNRVSSFTDDAEIPDEFAESEAMTTNEAVEESENITDSYEEEVTTAEYDEIYDIAYSSNSFSYKNPSIKELKNVAEGVKLVWDKQSGDILYRIYRKEKGKSFITLTDVKDTKYVDKSAQSGKYYTYTIRVIKNDGVTLLSNYNPGKEIYYLKSPKISKIDNLLKSQKITWNKILGADKYRVYLKDKNGWKKLGETENTTFEYKNVKSGEKYIFTVIADNTENGKSSSYYEKGFTKIFIAAPKISSVTNKPTGVELKWNASKGAHKYRIYRKTEKSSLTKLVDVDGLKYVDETAKPGTVYYYTIRCIENNEVNLQSYYNLPVKAKFINAPEITSVSNEATGQKITWKKDKNAESYRIYVKQSNGWKRLSTVIGSTYTHVSAKSGETYTYTVTGVSDDGFVSGYDDNGQSKKFVEAPKITSISKTTGGVKISFKKVKGAVSYRVYRKIKDKNWTTVCESTTESYFTDTNYDKKTAYSYTVRTLNEKGYVESGYIDEGKYYRDGKIVSGFVKNNGKTYWYDDAGNIVKNSIVGNAKDGYKYAGEDGVCVEGGEIQKAVNFVIAHGTGSTPSDKMYSCFSYLYRTFPYQRVYGIPQSGTDISMLANRMFDYGAGNCFCYGAAYACIAKVLGYGARVSTGMISAARGGVTPHGWAEVFNYGGWLICDPDMQKESWNGSYYMQTYASYPVKPLITYRTYTLSASGGKASWK